MRYFLIALVTWVSLAVVEISRGEDRATGPLRVHPANPRYFADPDGRAVYLTGSHTWANLQDQGPKDPPRPLDFDRYLAFLGERNHNFIRMWAWEQARWAPWSAGKGGYPSDWFIAPNPYERTGPGTALDSKPKFNLDRFDEAYFKRLRERVRKAGDRGIYVSVMLFQGWSSAKGGWEGTPWRGHPYHPANNVQGFNGNPKGDGGPDLDDPRLRERQAAYVGKVIDSLNDLDNVLYEVTNEGGNPSWDRFVVDLVHAYEKKKPKQHPVGLTGHGSETNDQMIAGPADWFSPGSNTWPDLKSDPRPADGKKVALLDTDHVFGVGGDGAWVWKAFLRGYNVLYMDPYDDPIWDPILAGQGVGVRDAETPRRAMGHARACALRMDLAATRPAGELASTGYCLAVPGKEYLAYLPAGGKVTLDLSAAKGKLEVEWMHPITGKITPGSPVDAGSPRALESPLAGDAVVYLRAPSVKAFPTAEGFGADAVGGRRGRVIEVTTLEDSGPGSLRAAMEASGPRIVVFRVSGTIALKSAIRIRAPYLTVAGQTSPGGVQVRGNGQPEGDWGVWCVNGAHDIVLRYLRVRMGGGMKHDAGNNLLFYGTAEPGIHDVIVDHCSVSWGSDTQLDWYGSYLDRATFQWNLIGEGYMGQHIGGNRAPKNITLHHNLYANLGSRTPLMQHANVFDFRNNVIYNWSGNNASVFGQFALNSSAFGNVTDNLWIAGPEGGYPYLNVGNGGPVRIDGKPAEAGGTKLYLSGNRGPRSPNGSANDWTGHGVNTWDYYERDHDGSIHLVDQAQYDAGKPFPAPPVRLDPPSILVDKVLSAIGACKPSRDAIDARIVKSVRDGTGTSRGGTTGPWPDLSSGAPAPPVDSDHDGMPDTWEKAHGLDPQNASDGAALAANDYTHVENYLNELAGDAVPGAGEAPASSAR